MTSLRALVVDDERPARTKLRRLLADVPEVSVVGEAGDGRRAVTMLRELEVDLVFLDVQMPGLDGFGVLAELAGEPLPAVIFLTAHDEYAVRAFEVHALDYLLKPVTAERLAAAVGRARQARSEPAALDLEARLERLLSELGRGPRYLERILVTENERSFLIRLDQVSWIESSRNYVVLHAPGKRYEVRGALTMLETRLDPAQWLRINRSALVRIDSIAQLEPWFHGEYRVLLRDGTRTTWSRRYLARAEEILGRHF